MHGLLTFSSKMKLNLMMMANLEHDYWGMKINSIKLLQSTSSIFLVNWVASTFCGFMPTTMGTFKKPSKILQENVHTKMI
jgi:hypothetical protein